jgi:hypothetical protein
MRLATEKDLLFVSKKNKKLSNPAGVASTPLHTGEAAPAQQRE